MNETTNNIFLIGMPGSGKSTVGKALAKRLGLVFYDADEELVRRTGVTIATIFEVEGEQGFRLREAQVIASLVHLQGIVLATGGGAILKEESRRALKGRGAVIYLHAGLDELVRRTRRDRNRPLLQAQHLQQSTPEQKLRELMAVRDPLYREIADLIVESTPRGPGRLAYDIIEKLVAMSPSAGHMADVPAPTEKR